jgi:hypothetical protein
MDVRNVRTQFIERNRNYACSYDPELAFDEFDAMAVPGGVRVHLGRRAPAKPGKDERHSGLGSFFHVLDATSVPGVDGRKHNCPVGTITYLEESVLFREHGLIGDVEGRMSFVTEDEARIDATYTGTLRFRAAPVAVDAEESFRGEKFEAAARIVPVFVSLDTRYRWLSESACVAFGTWTAERVSPLGMREVDARLDVYSLGSAVRRPAPSPRAALPGA